MEQLGTLVAIENFHLGISEHESHDYSICQRRNTFTFETFTNFYHLLLFYFLIFQFQLITNRMLFSEVI